MPRQSKLKSDTCKKRKKEKGAIRAYTTVVFQHSLNDYSFPGKQQPVGIGVPLTAEF